jgi:hypothetical protein
MEMLALEMMDQRWVEWFLEPSEPSNDRSSHLFRFQSVMNLKIQFKKIESIFQQ